MGHLVGDAADHEALQVAQAAAAHDDGVDAAPARLAEDGAGGVALADHGLDGAGALLPSGLGGAAHHLLAGLFALLAARLDGDGADPPHQGGLVGELLGDMHQVEGAALFLTGQLTGDGQRLLGVC